jgi:hypothetical protein
MTLDAALPAAAMGETGPSLNGFLAGDAPVCICAVAFLNLQEYPPGAPRIGSGRERMNRLLVNVCGALDKAADGPIIKRAVVVLLQDCDHWVTRQAFWKGFGFGLCACGLV